MWMNGVEITGANQARHECPNVTKGVRFLYRLMEAANDQSDGWHSWPIPGRAADKLMDLLKTAGNLPYGTRGTITPAQLKAAISPIRRMATTQKAKGFNFDVDAALQD
jgi:hypothetical protein